MSRRSGLPGLLIGLLALLLGAPAAAHKPSDSYLWLTEQEDASRLRIDVGLRDLEQLVGLDADGNGEITWAEVRARGDAIRAAVLSRIGLTRDGSGCPLRDAQPLAIARHSDGAYVVLRMESACTGSGLVFDYRLLFERDPSHRGLLQVLDRSGARSQIIFTPEHTRADLGRTQAGGRLATLGHYVVEGIWHIWVGYDHILFLLTLLLPAVFLRRGRKLAAVDALGPAARDLVRVVTAFTLAHSITLALATLGLVVVPARWVEAGIALSVVVSALNNLFPVLPFRRWVLAFAFGLVHGLGFANVLRDLGLPAGDLAVSLLGFNVGVELGQLVIVLGLFPLFYALRRGRLYRWGLHHAGSLAAAAVAALWFAERAFNWSLGGI